MPSWHAKESGAYSRTSNEAYENAVMAYSLLYFRKWTVNAVSALLGNFEYESGYNPWRWEGDKILASTQTDLIANSRTHGYGLGQFTPAGKYINSKYAKGYEGYAPNFSNRRGNPNDGNAQLMFIDEHADYYSTSAYPMSYAEFKVSELNPEYLAAVWITNYERPADPNATLLYRQQAARYWFDILGGVSPISFGKKGMPLWMMLWPF